MKTTRAERDKLQILADRASRSSAGTHFMASGEFRDFATPNLIQRLLSDFRDMEVSEHNALCDMAKMYDERPSLVIQERECMRMQRDALAEQVRRLQSTGHAAATAVQGGPGE